MRLPKARGPRRLPAVATKPLAGRPRAGRGLASGASTAWDAARGASGRWALAGALLGGLAGLVACAPAAWLVANVASATGQRLLLADARGTLWSGSAVVVLTGGADSRDASALPGRLAWRLGLRGLGLELRLVQACCLNGEAVLRWRPGFGRMTANLLPSPGWIGQWPSALLAGLGTPWNTLQLGGKVRLVSPGLEVESVQGRWRVDGRADVELLDVASRLSALPTLGSYRLGVSGDPAHAGAAALDLSTLQGALQLSGSGTWGPGGVRFRGEGRAASPADAPALINLLNIIGRRSGARTVISIG